VNLKKTIFARLPPLASAARCGPHPPHPPRYASAVSPIDAAAACGGFAAVRLAGRRYRSLSSNCGQCHVDSRGPRLNTHSLYSVTPEINSSLRTSQESVNLMLACHRFTVRISGKGNSIGHVRPSVRPSVGFHSSLAFGLHKV